MLRAEDVTATADAQSTLFKSLRRDCVDVVAHAAAAGRYSCQVDFTWTIQSAEAALRLVSLLRALGYTAGTDSMGNGVGRLNVRWGIDLGL